MDASGSRSCGLYLSLRRNLAVWIQQGLLDPVDKIAEDMGISFSELVRDFLNVQLRLYTYMEMRSAEEQLYNDYFIGENLTHMTALDGENKPKRS